MCSFIIFGLIHEQYTSAILIIHVNLAIVISGHAYENYECVYTVQLTTYDYMNNLLSRSVVKRFANYNL